MAASPYENEAIFRQMLEKAVSAGASDIHFKVGQPPGARIKGDMVYFRASRITAADAEAVARQLLSGDPKAPDLEHLREHDTAYEVPGFGRFRVNVYRQRGTLASVLRTIRGQIPTL